MLMGRIRKAICLALSCIIAVSCLAFPSYAEAGPSTGKQGGIGAQWDKDLSIQFADGDTYPYTGKPVTPKIVVKDMSGNLLEENVDYKVEYWNNTDPGTAAAYIFPTGNPSSAYGGTGYSTMAFHITGTKPEDFKLPDFDSFKLPDVNDLEVPDWVGKNGVTLPNKDGLASPDKDTSRGKPTALLPETAITKAISNGKGKIDVKWKKCPRVTGYQIQYSPNKKFSKNGRIKAVGKKKTSASISGVKKKKTYYIRIRTYKKSGGKTSYGKWSKVKKANIK